MKFFSYFIIFQNKIQTRNNFVFLLQENIFLILIYFLQYDLVCERTALKSTIQVALSLGKFLGAFLFGIISDKYGRKVSFFLGCILYIVSGPLVAFAYDYAMLIAGRIGLGAAASGIYHSAFVICK